MQIGKYAPSIKDAFVKNMQRLHTEMKLGLAGKKRRQKAFYPVLGRHPTPIIAHREHTRAGRKESISFGRVADDRFQINDGCLHIQQGEDAEKETGASD